jgi:hypothetical protein
MTMPRPRLSLLGLAALSLPAACASLEQPAVDPDPASQTKLITIGQVTSLDEEPGSGGGGSAWELTVDPTEIIAGRPFAADLEAKAIFDESFLNQGQALLGGFKELLVVGFQATVHVRKGAVGDDEVLTLPRSIPHVCWQSRTACDPANDLPGNNGLVGNTDCQPLGQTNPCGQLFEIPTSEDCDPGGFCDEKGHVGEGLQCELIGFCVTGGVEVPLTGQPGGYTADDSGSVHFGFADTDATGFEILREGGCNDGTWYREVPSFADPIGPNGARLLVGGFPLAVEFIMGEASRLDDGIDSCEARVSPTPDSNLIKFPIRAE